MDETNDVGAPTMGDRKSGLLRGDQYATLVATELVAELLIAAELGLPGPVELRLEAGKGQWDDILEFRGAQERIPHHWQIKRQTSAFEWPEFSALLDSARDPAIDHAHLAVPNSVPVRRVGELSKLRDICDEARRPGFDVASYLSRADGNTRNWLSRVEALCGSRDSAFELLRKLRITFHDTEVQLTTRIVERLAPIAKAPNTTLDAIRAFLSNCCDSTIAITISSLLPALDGHFRTFLGTGATGQLRNYLAAIQRLCAQFPYADLQPLGSRQGLQDIYVALEAQDNPAADQRGFAFQSGRVRLTPAEMIRDAVGAPIIVTGDPGSGKSTLLRYLAARSWTSPAEIGLKESRLPILVSLKALIDRPGSFRRRLSLAIDSDVPLDQDLPEDFVQQIIDAKIPILLLLDAYDEVPLHHRSQISALLRTALADRRDPLLITMRTSDFVEADVERKAFRHYQLLPLSDDSREAFATRWFGSRRMQFLEALELARTPGLSNNPLLLTIAARTFEEHASLQTNRSGLYQQFIEQCLRKAQTDGLDEEIGREMAPVSLSILEHLCLALSNAELEGRSPPVPRDIVAKFIAAQFGWGEQVSLAYAEKALSAIGRRLGFFSMSAGQAKFVHATFLEYLAAKGAVAHAGRWGRYSELFDSIKAAWNTRAWREVALFALAILGAAGVDSSNVLREIRAAAQSALDRIGPDDEESYVYAVSNLFEAQDFVAQAIVEGARADAEMGEISNVIGQSIRRYADFMVELEEFALDPFDAIARLRNTASASVLRELMTDEELGHYVNARAMDALSSSQGLTDEDAVAMKASVSLISGIESEEDAIYPAHVGRSLMTAGRTKIAAEVFDMILTLWRNAIDSEGVHGYYSDIWMSLVETRDSGRILRRLEWFAYCDQLDQGAFECYLQDVVAAGVDVVKILKTVAMDQRVNPWKRCDAARALVDLGEEKSAVSILKYLSRHLDDSYVRAFVNDVLRSTRRGLVR